MQEDRLSLLEERVLKAVRLIQELRGENARLMQRRTELEQQLSAMQAEKERNERELAEARAAVAGIERIEENRRMIEEKVGGLLEKLEQIG